MFGTTRTKTIRPRPMRDAITLLQSKKEILTDDELLQIMNSWGSTNVGDTAETSIVLFVSAHGSDGDTARRKKIIFNIISKYFRGDHSNLDEVVHFKEQLLYYMTNSVNLAITLGLPGPSSPMMGADSASHYAQLNGDPVYRWDGLSSSAVDIEIVRNIYRLFQTTGIASNDLMLQNLFTLSRDELRKNFELLWQIPSNVKQEAWQKNYQQLMLTNNIWKHKRLTENTDDRYYQLRPNAGESPIFDAHEGIHLLFEKLFTGIPSLLNPLTEYIPNTPTPNFDNNNIILQQLTINKILRYTLHLYNNDQGADNYQNVTKILKEFLTTRVYLSSIVMLGYCLKIDLLYIFDPACRPVTSSDRLRCDATGAPRQMSLFGPTAASTETMSRQYTEAYACFEDEVPDTDTNYWAGLVTTGFAAVADACKGQECVISGGIKSRKNKRSRQITYKRRNGTGQIFKNKRNKRNKRNKSHKNKGRKKKTK
jgi:hypothetical protein